MEKNDFKFVVDGSVYIFDIDKILKYVNMSNGKEVIEKEITDTFDFSTGTAQKDGKVVREVVTPMDKDIDNIRYDLIKTFIMLITSNEDTYPDMVFGVKMAFDSLLAIGLIKKI